MRVHVMFSVGQLVVHNYWKSRNAGLGYATQVKIVQLNTLSKPCTTV